MQPFVNRAFSRFANRTGNWRSRFREAFWATSISTLRWLVAAAVVRPALDPLRPELRHDPPPASSAARRTFRPGIVLNVGASLGSASFTRRMATRCLFDGSRLAVAVFNLVKQAIKTRGRSERRETRQAQVRTLAAAFLEGANRANTSSLGSHRHGCGSLASELHFIRPVPW